jgi:hypothetical protein
MGVIVRRVVGDSMSPTFVADEIVIGLGGRRPKKGNVVVAAVQGREVIKRITAFDSDSFFLSGDNASASTDSRQYGTVKDSDILGVIVMKIHLASATPASRPAFPKLAWISYGFAGFLTALLLISLFKFEELVLFIRNNFGYDGDDVLSKVYSALIVLLVLFSLPFLLRMRLSVLARFFSALFVLLLPVVCLAGVFLYELYGDGNGGWAMILFSAVGIWALASFWILDGKRALQALAKKV